MKKPAFGHFSGAPTHPSGSKRHSARRMKFRYTFLLRRNPLGLPLQKMIPPFTDHMLAGALSAIQNSSIRSFGISETKSLEAGNRTGASRNTNKARVTCINLAQDSGESNGEAPESFHRAQFRL